MATNLSNPEQQGWRFPATRPSLPEIHSSLPIPIGASFLRKLFLFAGPGFLVAVGYMDPAIGPPTSLAVRNTTTPCCQ